MIKPVWKRAVRWVMTCPKCNSQLGGNGSVMMPYICQCGTWDYLEEENTYVLDRGK